MTNRLLALTAIAFLVLAPGLLGQSALTGKWRGQTANGFQVELDLTATGTELKGTLTREGERFPIQEGNVSKNTFTFKATMNDQTEGFTGAADGDQMKVWLDRQGPSMAAVLTRVK
jgi:hypothetical protein